MFCANCGASVTQSVHFCVHCGQALLSSSNHQQANSSDSDPEEWEGDFDEEEVLKYYFNRGFSYQEILLFLSERHQHPLSYSTLLRRLKKYGLGRRGVSDKVEFNCTFCKVRSRIAELISGPCSSAGYRAIWHTLEMEGLRVPRVIVHDLLREMDPAGTELRKKHRLKRRRYQNPGPNFAWHIDGYDKLKHWGFPIHGGIDGFSRKILWLKVARSNNSPHKIASYVKTVSEQEGCPVELITDLGTENGLAASIHTFFRDNPDAHRYVSSPRNQRIEGWWSFYSKSHCIWWRNFFNDLEFQGTLDTSSEIGMECLWYCFSKVLQAECDAVKERWNTHRIRRSGNNTVPGHPDSLYFLPELHGASNNRIPVTNSEVHYVSQHIIEDDHRENNDYQDYFSYARTSLSIPWPKTWEDALSLYRKLMYVAVHGNNPNT